VGSSSSGGSSSGVELDKGVDVGERVSLGGKSGASSLSSDDALDLVGVDDSVDVRVGHERSGKLVSLLGRSSSVSSVDGVELLESILSPDAESSKMASGGKLQKIQSVDASQFDSGNVSESLGKRALLVEDDQRSSSLDVSSVSHLSLSASNLSGLDNSGDVDQSVDGAEKSSGLGSLVEVIDGLVVDDERDLGDGLDSVSSGHDQSGDGGSGDSRSQSVSLLSNVDLSVPSSPGLSGGEHASSSAHISESSLSSSVGSSSRNSRNTGNGSSSSPRLG